MVAAKKPRAKKQGTESSAPKLDPFKKDPNWNFDQLEPEGQSTYLQFIEAIGDSKNIEPLSDGELKMQARFISSGSLHPFDILQRISINPFCKPSDRINAAKTLLEYAARKVPSKLEVTGKDGAPLALDSSQLSKLSNKELSMLEQLLMKASLAEGAE